MKAAVCGLVLLVGAAAHASDARRHMGVATCASAVCHGSVGERADADILHNEYVVWSQRDPHARAYRTLLSAESQRMAEKLGIGPAHESPACLACHADDVSAERRGPRFLVSDGVGCESCHGGSESWLAPHTERGASYSGSIRRGMRRLEDPDVLAQVCAGCHVGEGERFAAHGILGRFAGHDIMGAGHPRLQFELATYLRLWPAHHRVDADYRQRKQVPDGLELWVAGQLRSARNVLWGLRSERFMATSLWPELAYFDCHACHAPMDAGKWEPRAAARLRPGAVRLNDSALAMVGWWLDVTDRQAAARWRADVAALHAATQRSYAAVEEASGRLLAQLDASGRPAAARGLSDEQRRALYERVRAESVRGGFNDYLTAEQAVMLVALLHEAAGGGSEVLDGLYRSVADQHRFRVEAFRNAMRQLPVKLNVEEKRAEEHVHLGDSR